MHGKIVDSFGGVPRDLAWRLKSGVTPDKLFTIILECGQSYAFHDLEVFGIRDYMNRFGEEFDCIHCDSFLTRTSKRLAGHHLSGALYRLGRSAASTKSEMSIAVIAAIISATTPLGIVAVLVLAGGRRTAPLSSSNTADHGRRIDHLDHDPFDIVVAHNCGPDGWTGYNPGSTEPGGARGVLPEGGSLHHRRRPDDDRVHPGAGRRSVPLANAA